MCRARKARGIRRDDVRSGWEGSRRDWEGKTRDCLGCKSSKRRPDYVFCFFPSEAAAISRSRSQWIALSSFVHHGSASRIHTTGVEPASIERHPIIKERDTRELRLAPRECESRALAASTCERSTASIHPFQAPCSSAALPVTNRTITWRGWFSPSFPPGNLPFVSMPFRLKALRSHSFETSRHFVNRNSLRC